MKTPMKALVSIALCSLVAGAGCTRRSSVATANAEAAAEYRAAWEKRQAGDEQAYKDGLARLTAKWPDSRAGRRAKEALLGTPSGGAMSAMVALAAYAGSTLQTMSEQLDRARSLAPLDPRVPLAPPDPDDDDGDVVPDTQ